MKSNIPRLNNSVLALFGVAAVLSLLHLPLSFGMEESKAPKEDLVILALTPVQLQGMIERGKFQLPQRDSHLFLTSITDENDLIQFLKVDGRTRDYRTSYCVLSPEAKLSSEPSETAPSYCEGSKCVNPLVKTISLSAINEVFSFENVEERVSLQYQLKKKGVPVEVKSLLEIDDSIEPHHNECVIQ